MLLRAAAGAPAPAAGAPARTAASAAPIWICWIGTEKVEIEELPNATRLNLLLSAWTAASSGVRPACQDDSSPAHHWLTATAADWSVPGSANLIDFSEPTTEANPDRWQDDYEWYFYAIPKNAACTFRIYIPDSSFAGYVATYFWTPGTAGYIDANAFTINQPACRQTWYSAGPFRFPTGKAMLELTDARSQTANAPLAAAPVRLTCG